METRSIKELLIIVRDSKHYFEDGLCGLIRVLYNNNVISKEEENLIDSYMDKNAPDSNFGYWYIRGLWPPRLKWLNEQIEKL